MLFQELKDVLQNTFNNNGRGITIGKIIKLVILAVVAMLALSIVLAMFKWVFNIEDNDYKRNSIDMQQMFDDPVMMLGFADDIVGQTFTDGDYGGGMAISNSMVRSKMMAPELDIMPMPYISESASKNAEDFETREYRATYEENNIDKTCKKFEDLKPLEYVVFSNANKSETYCNYTFKVESDREQEVILLIESLGPQDFNASTYTLERSITNNSNEIDILEKKIDMLDSLLSSAQSKYAALRTTGNASVLVQAINNEINLIERITTQKLNVQSQIDRLTNSKGVQEERVDYSQFNISVSEWKFIDLGSIGESWKFAFERFISEVSGAVQDLTIGLVLFVVKLAKFVIFLGVGILAVVAAAKFLWSMIKKIWRT